MTPDTPHVRPARAADLPSLARMHRALLCAEAALGGPPVDASLEPERWLRPRLRRRDLRLWIAELGGRPAGYGECALLIPGRRRLDPRRLLDRLRPPRAGEGAVDFIFVTPEARRQGVGTALMQTMLAWLRQHGARTLHAHALARNAPSLALFERCGFARHGVLLRLTGSSIAT